MSLKCSEISTNKNTHTKPKDLYTVCVAKVLKCFKKSETVVSMRTYIPKKLRNVTCFGLFVLVMFIRERDNYDFFLKT